MRVLSLYDGIACGRLALQRAGIHYDEYIAVENEPAARAITDWNEPAIRPCNDVYNERAPHTVGKVDLMIAGFPCQSFSTQGARDDFGGVNGMMYREMLRWRDICKPDYFVFENVRPTHSAAHILNKAIGVKYIIANSKFYGAQNRQRAFWTSSPFNPHTKPNGIVADDYMDADDWLPCRQYTRCVPYKKNVKIIGLTQYREWRTMEWDTATLLDGTEVYAIQRYRVFGRQYKMPTIVSHDLYNVSFAPGPHEDTVCRKLTMRENCRMQHIPPDYIINPWDCAVVSKTKALHCIGNGFDVAVVADIINQVINGRDDERARGPLL